MVYSSRKALVHHHGAETDLPFLNPLVRLLDFIQPVRFRDDFHFTLRGEFQRFVEILRAVLRAAERSEEHTSELQSRLHLVCRLLLEKKKQTKLRQYKQTQQHSDDIRPRS